jgi:hypothetical protein
MRAIKNIPVEINYEDFKWLRKGDRIEIAKRTSMSESMVRATLRKETFNLEIVTEAMKMVVERKRRFMEIQAESTLLSQALKMKVA